MELRESARRMHPASKNPLLLTVLVAVIALSVWPGCATVPVPAKRDSIAGRKTSDFGFIRKGKTTRSDVVAKLGKPTEDFSDIRVTGYYITTIQPRSMFLITVIPAGTGTRGRAELQLALIEFDEQDRVKRSGILTTAKTAREAAVNWLAGKSP